MWLRILPWGDFRGLSRWAQHIHKAWRWESEEMWPWMQSRCQAAMSQGMQEPPSRWKIQRNKSSSKASRTHIGLDFSPLRQLMVTLDLQKCRSKFVFFEVTKFVVICFNSNRKLIQGLSWVFPWAPLGPTAQQRPVSDFQKNIEWSMIIGNSYDWPLWLPIGNPMSYTTPAQVLSAPPDLGSQHASVSQLCASKPNWSWTPGLGGHFPPHLSQESTQVWFL